MSKQVVVSNPFVGLRPFESEEDYLFFGREVQTLELLQRLHQHHFVAGTGSSGSGKSSLIKAGLIPALQAGYLVNERDQWVIADMKPGDNPLLNLANSIIGQLPETADNMTAVNLVAKIRRVGVDAVLMLLENLWERKINLFLLVDQFEELFRFSNNSDKPGYDDDAIEFVGLLLELSGRVDLPVYIVLTMRSDFIGDCTRFFGLPEALNNSQYLVPRLTRTQLKTTIEGPVRLFKATINPVLVSRLLNDAQVIVDELPLLQHAMMRTWDHEMKVDRNGELDLGDYESIGGVHKALSNHADEALEGLSETQLAQAKGLFQALTTVDSNGRKTRKPAALRELALVTGLQTDELLLLINRFIEDNRSFLVISKQGNAEDWLVDISHESLIRQWSTLGAWVDEAAEFSKTYGGLVESAELYMQERKDLMTGVEYDIMCNWYTSNSKAFYAKQNDPGFDTANEYLKKSIENDWVQKKKKKRNSRVKLLLIAGVLLAALFVLALGYYTFKEKRLRTEAEFQKQNAVAESRKAAEAAAQAGHQKLISDSNAREAVIQRNRADTSTMEAIKQATAAQLQSSIAMAQTGLAIRQQKLAMLAKDELEVEKQKISVTGEAFRLITLALQQVNSNPTLALRIAEAAMKKQPDSIVVAAMEAIYEENSFYKMILPAQVIPRRSPYPFPIRVSANGTRYVRAGDQDSGFIHDSSGKQLAGFARASRVFSAAFSPKANLLVMGTYDDEVNLLQVSDGKELQPLKDNTTYQVRAVAFSADGSRVIAGNRGGDATLWNINGKAIRQFHHPQQVLAVAFGKDDMIATGSMNDSIKIWSKDGNLLQAFPERGEIRSLAFSPDGLVVAAGSLSLHIWKNNELTECQGHTNKVVAICFSNDGDSILTGSDDGTAILWNLDGKLLKIFRGHNAPVHSVAFSADGNYIITASTDGKVLRWNIGNKPPVNQFLHSSELEPLSPEQKKQFAIE